MDSTQSHTPKEVSFTFTGEDNTEDDSAELIRYIGVNELAMLDPFLMMDSFKLLLPSGFPDHVHRGYETVNYITAGKMNFEDIKGHKG